MPVPLAPAPLPSVLGAPVAGVVSMCFSFARSRERLTIPQWWCHFQAGTAGGRTLSLFRVILGPESGLGAAFLLCICQQQQQFETRYGEGGVQCQSGGGICYWDWRVQ